MNDKQRAFVVEYMKDRNATQAYIRAGYSAKGANKLAPRLMANDGVRAEIARLTEEYQRTAGLTVVDVLEEMKKIAFSDIAGAFDPITGALLPVHKMTPEARAAIAGIDVQELAGGIDIGTDDAPKHVPMFVKKVKLWDKQGALKTLLEFLKGAPPAPTTVVNVQVNAVNAVVDLRALQAG